MTPHSKIKCDICDKEITQKQMAWEEKLNAPCYCDIWRQIKRLRNKIKALKGRIEDLNNQIYELGERQ